MQYWQCLNQETTTDRPTVGQALRMVASDPVEYLIRRWNWKSAVTSALMRGAIFFTTNLASGLAAATGALLAEFGYRTIISGFYGSLTQAFRRCQPVWAATLFVMLALPLSSHAIEFTVHYLRQTPQLRRSVTISICFTIVATLFNYYAMRRGVLVVGEGRRSFGSDLKRMPEIIGGFLASGPLFLWRLVAGRK